MSFADSMRQTASMVRWASAPSRLDWHYAPRARSLPRGALALLLLDSLLASSQLGRELGAEVLGLEDLADLDLGPRRSGSGSA